MRFYLSVIAMGLLATVAFTAACGDGGGDGEEGSRQDDMTSPLVELPMIGMPEPPMPPEYPTPDYSLPGY